MLHYRNMSSCAVGKGQHYPMRPQEKENKYSSPTSKSSQCASPSTSVQVFKLDLKYYNTVTFGETVEREPEDRKRSGHVHGRSKSKYEQHLLGQDWSKASNNRSGSDVWQICWQTCFSSNLYVLYINAVLSGRNNLFQKCHASDRRALVLNRFHPLTLIWFISSFDPMTGLRFIWGMYTMAPHVSFLPGSPPSTKYQPSNRLTLCFAKIRMAFFFSLTAFPPATGNDFGWSDATPPANWHLTPSKLTGKHLTTNDLLIKEADRFTTVKWHWQFRCF